MSSREDLLLTCVLCGRTGSRGFVPLDTNPAKRRCKSLRACSQRASKSPGYPAEAPAEEALAEEALAEETLAEAPAEEAPAEEAPAEVPGDWYLIETPGQAPRCERLSLPAATALRESGSCLTLNSPGSLPMAVAGETPLIAYQLADLSFNKLQTDFVVAVVRPMRSQEIPKGLEPLKIKPWDHDFENVEPGEVISASPDRSEPTGYKALRYIFALKRKTGGSSFVPELIKVGHVEAESIDQRYSIEDNRALKALADGLTYRIANYRSNGQVVRASVSHQDLHKTHGQSVWHSETLIALDAQTKHLTMVRDYLRTVTKDATKIRNRIDGLGPVRVSETETGEQTVIFVGSTGSFETETGKDRADYYADLRDKPGLNIFGINPDLSLVMKLAYEELFKLGDCSPGDPGICLIPVGVLVLTPLSALENGYRVATFTHGPSGSGKTAFEILLLSTQSPYARGYSVMQKLVTVSARPGRGGSTTNGINMVLQYAGGFRALVDDYTTRSMSQLDLAQRGSGLSILVGSLEGEAPTKQTWTKAGPDFAQGYAPQSSFAISGEVFPTDLESVINRMLILKAPDSDIRSAGGYDYTLIKSLDSKESGDLRHAAFCDLAKFTLSNPETVAEAYSRAYAVTSQWADGSDFSANGSERMLRRYAIALTGWTVALERARDEYGLDQTDRLPGIEEALKATALAQYRMISGTLDLPTLLRSEIRKAILAKELSFPGPPQFDKDSGAEILNWTAPQYSEAVSEEEPRDESVPEFLTSWSDLGLALNKESGEKWAPVSKHWGGYFRSPKKQRGNRYAFPYRVQMDGDRLKVLSEVLERRTGKTGLYTPDTIKRALLSSEQIAVKGQGGGVNDNGKRTVEVSAAWLFADENGEED